MPQSGFLGRGFRLKFAITVSCGMAFILFGYDQGVFSGIVGNEDFLEKMNHPSDSLTGIIVSIYNLGCLAGCIINFIVGDALGRRKVMWLAMSLVLVGTALQTTAFSVAHMLVARFVAGLGTGLETSTVPMYQSELSAAKHRGRLVCTEAMFVGIGIVISYWFDYGMSFVDGPISWRLPIACQAIFAIIVIVLVFGLPESPRWLYSKSCNSEALEVLCTVYDRAPDHPKILKEQNEVFAAIALENLNGRFKWSQLFKNDEVHTLRRVVLAYGMQFINQVCGINLVVYFVPTALQDNVGLSRNLSLLLGGVIQCMFFIGAIFPALMVDRIGRRKPMMWGSFGMGVSMMLISILLSFQGKGAISTPTASAAVAFFFTYMLIFGGTVNSIPWCYVPEILPLGARTKGTAVGISANWLWNFVIVMITPVILNRLQWKAYLIFMCTNFAFVPVIYYFYPETSNLSLEEVDFLFTDKHVREGVVTDSGRSRVMEGDSEKGFTGDGAKL